MTEERKMEIYGAKKDYLEGWCMMHFDGEYNESEALEYIKKCYPDMSKVTSVVEPYDSTSGYRQLGTVHFE